MKWYVCDAWVYILRLTKEWECWQTADILLIDFLIIIIILDIKLSPGHRKTTWVVTCLFSASFFFFRRTCCWNIAVRVLSRWSTLEARATLTSAFTRTSNRVSTARLKLFSACLTVHRSTCGVSVRFYFDQILLYIVVLDIGQSVIFLIHFFSIFSRCRTRNRVGKNRLVDRSEKIEKK